MLVSAPKAQNLKGSVSGALKSWGRRKHWMEGIGVLRRE